MCLPSAVSVIIKSTHRNPEREGRRAERDRGLSDANEVAVNRLVSEELSDVRVPMIYFSGEVFSRSSYLASRVLNQD